MPERNDDAKRLSELIKQARRLNYEAKQIMTELNRVQGQIAPLIRKKSKPKRSI